MEDNSQFPYNYLDKYLIEASSQGRYFFTVEELHNAFNLFLSALRQNLFRLKLKNKISIIRQGFYVIIPPE